MIKQKITLNMDQQQQQQRQKCENQLEKSLLNNKNIQILLDKINDLGCTIPKDFIKCRSCDANVAGGFLINTNDKNKTPLSSYQPQIMMCENTIGGCSQEIFDKTLMHELVHAYDQCTAKIDYKNCLHHACTEIRASAISGECDSMLELARGNKIITKGHQICTKRRAEISVSANPHCKDIAAAAIEAVFDQCYNDSSPFKKGSI